MHSERVPLLINQLRGAAKKGMWGVDGEVERLLHTVK